MMKQVLFLVFLSLALYETSARMSKYEQNLARRMELLTESEEDFIAKRKEPGCAVDFDQLGCFKDKRGERVMKKLLFSDRRRGGPGINWKKFDQYVAGLTCRCAQAAKEQGFTYFATQNYGECWASTKSVLDYDRYGASLSCINTEFGKCKDKEMCVGGPKANLVFGITEEGSGGDI